MSEQNLADQGSHRLSDGDWLDSYQWETFCGMATKRRLSPDVAVLAACAFVLRAWGGDHEVRLSARLGDGRGTGLTVPLPATGSTCIADFAQELLRCIGDRPVLLADTATLTLIQGSVEIHCAVREETSTLTAVCSVAGVMGSVGYATGVSTACRRLLTALAGEDSM